MNFTSLVDRRRDQNFTPLNSRLIQNITHAVCILMTYEACDQRKKKIVSYSKGYGTARYEIYYPNSMTTFTTHSTSPITGQHDIWYRYCLVGSTYTRVVQLVSEPKTQKFLLQLSTKVPGIKLNFDSISTHVLVDISPERSLCYSESSIGHVHPPIWEESVIIVCEKVDSFAQPTTFLRYRLHLRRITTLEWNCTVYKR